MANPHPLCERCHHNPKATGTGRRHPINCGVKKPINTAYKRIERRSADASKPNECVRHICRSGDNAVAYAFTCAKGDEGKLRAGRYPVERREDGGVCFENEFKTRIIFPDGRLFAMVRRRHKGGEKNLKNYDFVGNYAAERSEGSSRV
jgi:hypothetical protein